MHRHLHNLRQKPEHVRRNVAIGASLSITAIVAVFWVTTLAASGAFALAPLDGVSKDLSNSGLTDSFSTTGKSFSQLLGAAGAATSGQGASSSKPALTIVDGGSTSSLEKGTDPSQPEAPASATPTTLTF